VSRLYGMASLVRVGLVRAALAAVLAVGATAALAAPSDPMSKVAQGVNPASLPGSSVFGDTPPDTP
jgi:uncharacterized membrane protein